MGFRNPIASAPVTLAGGTTVELADGAVVGLAAGTAVGLSPGASVEVASGTIDIGNTPAVTVESGTIDIATIPDITIAGTPTVVVGSGTIDIGTAPAIVLAAGTSVDVGTIPAIDVASGAEINVLPAPSQILDVSGAVLLVDQAPVTVDIAAGAVQSYTISSGRSGAAVINQLLILIHESQSPSPIMALPIDVNGVYTFISDSAGNLILYDEAAGPFTPFSSGTSYYGINYGVPMPASWPVGNTIEITFANKSATTAWSEDLVISVFGWAAPTSGPLGGAHPDNAELAGGVDSGGFVRALLTDDTGVLQVAIGGTVNATEIQGTPVATGAPTTGQMLAFNGTDYAPTTPSSGSLDPQGGELTAAVVMSSAETFYTVFTTPSLATGTWLLRADMLCTNGGTDSVVMANVIASTGAGTFSGRSSDENFITAAGDYAQLSLDCLIDVTTAGTFVIQAKCNTATTDILYEGTVFTTPGVTGWTAIKVA